MVGSSEILNASILIVDDQEANVLLLEQMLRSAGYTSVASTRDSREVCELQLIEAGYHRLVVDMGDVHFVDSSGLGALVSALKTVKLLEGGGDIRLANVQPPVVALLEIIRLHRVFSRYPSVEQAVQSFA